MQLSVSVLCGAGVAFQFMRAFYQAMEEDESQLEELLSMLAIATVCDVVDLTGENRIFVKEGLRRIKDTQNIGLKALLNVHDLMDKQIQSYGTRIYWLDHVSMRADVWNLPKKH